MKKLSTTSQKELKDLFFNHFDMFINGIKKSCDYFSHKEDFVTLNPMEQYYCKNIIEISKKATYSISAINELLYKYIINNWITTIEYQNKGIFVNIDNFENIQAKIKELRNQKEQLSIQQTFAKIEQNANSIKNSKKYKEMLRATESKRKWSVSKYIKKFSFELFNNIKVWLLTPDVVSEILPLVQNLFDIVIFDEASQMYIERGIPTILRGKQVVIAGDSKQLRPSSLGSGRIEYEEEIDDEESPTYAALEEESLLDLARFRYDDILLNYHYRSKYEELIAFSNYAFYNGKLYISPNTETPDLPPIQVHYMDNARWIKRTNIEEAKYIVEMLKDFLCNRKNNETIGIVTFNINQRDLINDLIDNEGIKNPEFAEKVRLEKARKKDGEDIGLFVKNIENVQGDERDVIVFSIGYAKNENGRLVHNFGWLNQVGGENRLNVAISRAKRKIHIVTSFYPSELDVSKTVNEGPKIFKKYLEYAFAVNNGRKNEAREILLSFGDTLSTAGNVQFDSPFEEQVYDALKEKGYEVHSQIGVGGYNIDLAIKKGENYILGIECDGALYHSSAEAKEYDFHRQKYLECRGWKIHRIWSSNWWKNPEREIEKICKIVG